MMKIGLILVGLIASIQCAHVFDSISNKNDEFIYIFKFCYSIGLSSKMTFTVQSLQSSNPNAPLFVGLYLDKSWDDAYKTGMSCETQLTNSSAHVPLSSTTSWNITLSDYVQSHFWMLAIINCQAATLTMDYEVIATQSDGSELSCQELGLPVIYLCFGIGLAIVMGVNIAGAIMLIRKNSFHPIMRLFNLSLLLELIAILFNLIHYWTYQSKGEGIGPLHSSATVLDGFAVILFVTLLILISTGWGITHQHLSHLKERIKEIVAVFAIFLICYIVLFFWEAFGIDPGLAIYVYDSVPGYIYMAVRFLTMLYFIFNLRRTILHETDPGKRTFYLSFGILYSLYLIGLPIVVLSALRIAPTARQKSVVGLELGIEFLGYSVLSFLLFPPRAAKYFSLAVPDVFGSASYDRL